MITLRDQQLLFLESIFSSANSPTDKRLLATIAASENMSAQQHFDIYREGVRAALGQALADTFPVCLALVGEPFFNGMANRFIQQYASETPDLGDYSPLFIAFIRQFKPAEQLFYLADVAQLEWYWHQVFHAKDDATLDFNALSEVGDQDLVFRLVTAGRLMQSAWPIQKIWQVNQRDYEGDASVDLDEGQVYLWIWRNGFEMRIDPVEVDEWKLLSALAEHKPFSQVCDELAAENIDLISWLPRFVQKGWICDFSICDQS